MWHEWHSSLKHDMYSLSCLSWRVIYLVHLEMLTFELSAISLIIWEQSYFLCWIIERGGQGTSLEDVHVIYNRKQHNIASGCSTNQSDRFLLLEKRKHPNRHGHSIGWIIYTKERNSINLFIGSIKTSLEFLLIKFRTILHYVILNYAYNLVNVRWNTDNFNMRSDG